MDGIGEICRDDGSRLCYDGVMLNEKRKTLLFYTVFFAIGIAVIFLPLWQNGKSLLRKSDGLDQYYYTLCYIGEWLRRIVRSIFVDFHPTIPRWDLSIGLGSDIIGTLHYYGLGDPLNFLAVFVPLAHTEALYTVLVFARMYLAGLSFMAYCRYRRLPEEGLSVCALVYVFSGFMLLAGVRWVSFMWPFITFPLILLGIDKAFHEKKVWPFGLSILLAAVSGIYFFYMQTILAGIYGLGVVAGRIFDLYKSDNLALLTTGVRTDVPNSKPLKDVAQTTIVGIEKIDSKGEEPEKKMDFAVRSLEVKGLLVTILKLIAAYIVALFLSMPILYPVIENLLSNARVGLAIDIPRFFDEAFYKQLPLFMTTISDIYNDNGIPLGVAPIAFAAIVVMILHPKQKKWEWAAFLLCLIGIGLPYFSHVMNGFGYVVHRWVWVFALLMAYLLADNWVALKALSRLQKLPAMIVHVALAGIVIYWAYANMYHVYNDSDIFSYENYIGAGKANDELGNEALKQLMLEAADEQGPCRYDSYDFMHSKQENLNPILRLNGTQFYYSITDDAVYNYYRDILMPVNCNYVYRDMDSRLIPQSMAGVRFFLVSEDEASFVPCGYGEPCATADDVLIYRNPYALPLGYFYDSFLDKKDWDALNIGDKQYNQICACLIDEPDEALLESYACAAPERIALEEPYDPEIVRTSSCDEEVYYVAEGIHYSSDWEEAGWNVKYGDRKKHWEYKTKYSPTYVGIDSFAMQMGSGAGEIESVLEAYGDPNITIDSERIIKLPLEKAYEQLNRLKAHALDEITVAGNCIRGKASLDHPMILQLAVPYSSHWRVKIDGADGRIYRSGMYMAVPVTAGEHSVEFKYHL